MNKYKMDKEFENEAVDLPSESGYYIIDRDLFKYIFLDHAYIEVDTLHKGYYEDSIKPLITCEQCSKWKIRELCGRAIYNMRLMDWIETDPDDTCKDATPKEACK